MLEVTPNRVTCRINNIWQGKGLLTEILCVSSYLHHVICPIHDLTILAMWIRKCLTQYPAFLCSRFHNSGYINFASSLGFLPDCESTNHYGSSKPCSQTWLSIYDESKCSVPVPVFQRTNDGSHAICGYSVWQWNCKYWKTKMVQDV